MQAHGFPRVGLHPGPALNRVEPRPPIVSTSQRDDDLPGETVVTGEDHRLYRGWPLSFTLWA